MAERCAFVHACMCACMHACVRACVHAYVRARIACVRACVGGLTMLQSVERVSPTHSLTYVLLTHSLTMLQSVERVSPQKAAASSASYVRGPE